MKVTKVERTSGPLYLACNSRSWGFEFPSLWNNLGFLLEAPSRSNPGQNPRSLPHPPRNLQNEGFGLSGLFTILLRNRLTFRKNLTLFACVRMASSLPLAMLPLELAKTGMFFYGI